MRSGFPEAWIDCQDVCQHHNLQAPFSHTWLQDFHCVCWEKHIQVVFDLEGLALSPHHPHIQPNSTPPHPTQPVNLTHAAYPHPQSSLSHIMYVNPGHPLAAGHSPLGMLLNAFQGWGWIVRKTRKRSRYLAPTPTAFWPGHLCSAFEPNIEAFSEALKPFKGWM